MVQVTPFLLVLSLALVAPGFSARKCPLEGSWRNEKGHILEIWSVNDPTCECDGYYHIGNRIYKLTERWRYWKDNMIIFGFKVYWLPDLRTIFQSWYRNESGKEILLTNWYKQKRVNGDWETIGSGTYTFTRLYPWPASGIVGDFNTDRSTWDADPLSCTNMGQHSQEKGGSAGDFKAGGNAWNANPTSGSTMCF